MAICGLFLINSSVKLWFPRAHFRLGYVRVGYISESRGFAYKSVPILPKTSGV